MPESSARPRPRHAEENAAPALPPAEVADFLATTGARKVAQAIVEAAASYARTAPGRARIRELAPLPTEAAAAGRAQAILVAKRRAQDLDRDAIATLLRRIRPPVEPPHRAEPGRLVVAPEGVQERLRSIGVHKWAPVAGLHELAQADDYDVILVLSEGDADGIDHALELPDDASLAQLAPESVLAWFTANRDVLEAMSMLAVLTTGRSKAADALRLTDGLPPSGPVPDLVAAAKEIQPLLRQALRQRAATLSVTGAEWLDSFGRKNPPALQAALDETLRQGRDLLRAKTGVSLQAFVAEPSLELDEEEIRASVQRLRSTSAIGRFQARATAARQLGPMRAGLEAEIEAWFAFDADFALGCFATANDLHPARFGPALSFAGSVHLALASDPAAQRIAYALPGTQRIALLTGANSGGKTTLLEHIAQLAIMARMGLPVVGTGVQVPWVDEVHLVTARRSLDAGAFESFLKSFLPVVVGDRRRLVLADEVESVTELEAAGRILGFFLDRLAKTRSFGVVVTHVAPQILRHTKAAVRVDGIEATGLDERNRLVVDRAPRMGHYARSTPELIVQRLAAVTKGPHKALYQDLLRAFADDAPT